MAGTVSPSLREFVPFSPSRHHDGITGEYLLTIGLRLFASDVIPWQCWTRYPDDCARSSAKFVDVDFPALVQKKRDVVLRTPELASHLSGVTLKSSDPHVILCSEAYYQVGIDLRQTAALEASLASIVDIRDCTFLFVAEVSITYMETDAADALIKWASTLGQGKHESTFPYASDEYRST